MQHCNLKLSDADADRMAASRVKNLLRARPEDCGNAAAVQFSIAEKIARWGNRKSVKRAANRLASSPDFDCVWNSTHTLAATHLAPSEGVRATSETAFEDQMLTASIFISGYSKVKFVQWTEHALKRVVDRIYDFQVTTEKLRYNIANTSLCLIGRTIPHDLRANLHHGEAETLVVGQIHNRGTGRTEFIACTALRNEWLSPQELHFAKACATDGASDAEILAVTPDAYFDDHKPSYSKKIAWNLDIKWAILLAEGAVDVV